MGLKNTWDTFAGLTKQKSMLEKYHGMRFISHQIAHDLIFLEGKWRSELRRFLRKCHALIAREKIVYRKENLIDGKHRINTLCWDC